MPTDADDRPSAAGPGVHQRATAPAMVSPRTGAVVSLVLAVLLGALSGLVMIPAALHLRSLKDGERARATLYERGSCMAGQCRVRFEADGRTIVAGLPVGSGGGKSGIGTEWTVRYRADDPQTVAREADVGGGGALPLGVMSAVFALLFLVTAASLPLYAARTRRAADGLPSRSASRTPHSA